MTDRPTLKLARRTARVILTSLSWLLLMLWIIQLTLARGSQHANWVLQSPISTPTPTPYATFTADSTTLMEGTCTWLRWNVGNAQAEGEQERLLKITVVPRTPTPTFTPTRTPVPFSIFTPTRTPTAIPTQIPTPTWTPPSGQFPPPSLMGPVTPVPTTPVLEQPTLSSATAEPPSPSPTPVAEVLPQERPAPEQPQEPAHREPARRTPPPLVEGTRQDVMRLFMFGLVGIISAAVLGLISLILWWRKL